MAVGLERAHPQLVGEGEGLLVVGFGQCGVRGIAVCGNLAEEAQGIGLVATLLAFTGERQRALGESLRLFQAASQHLRLPQRETTGHLRDYHFRCSCPFHRPREQGHGVGDAPAQGVRRTQGWSEPGEIGWEVHVLTDAYGPFKQGECPGQVALVEGQQTDPPRGQHETRRVSNRLGNAEPFFPEGTALSERPQLGMARGESHLALHSRQEDLTEALATVRPVEERHSLPEAVDRPTIVSLGMVGLAEGQVRQRVQDDLPASRGECEGTLGGGDGLVIHAYGVEVARQKDRDLSQPPRVVEGHREGLGLA